MKIFKVIKSYQGGQSIYFAKMPNALRMGKSKINTAAKGIHLESNWQSQLESWGERTHGGHNYGYHITAKRVRKLPKGKKVFLKFNIYELEKVGNAHKNHFSQRKG